MERDDSKFTMDLKRAISLVSMPDEWFNTPAKRELLEKAVTYIRNDRDMQTIFRGEVTADERLGARNAQDRAFFLLTGQIEQNSSINVRRGVILDKTKPVEKFVQIRKRIEKEKIDHALDYDVIETDNLLSKYHEHINGLVVLDADAAIRLDSNSAVALSTRTWATREDGKHVTRLDEYIVYFTRTEEFLSKVDQKELKKLGISLEEHKKNLATIKSRLENAKGFKKDVDDYNWKEDTITPNQDHLPISERTLTWDDLHKKDNEYYKALENVSKRLGLPNYLKQYRDGTVVNDKLSKDNFYKIEGYLKGLKYTVNSHRSGNKEYYNSTKKIKNYKEYYNSTKKIKNYKTPTEKDELKLDDDAR